MKAQTLYRKVGGKIVSGSFNPARVPRKIAAGWKRTPDELSPQGDIDPPKRKRGRPKKVTD